MNYRHAFHAGNFADVMKHVVLTRILHHLRQKEKPFRVVDTHAGIGRYDLAGAEAGRTAEWEGGIGRMGPAFADEVEALLGPYRQAVASVRSRFGEVTYPGSPAILREMLRPCDRAILIEKHPEDADVLAVRFNAVGTLKVIRGDGWTLLRGLLPPRERRGLILIDPPYEVAGELAGAPARIADALSRWETGTFMLWYPIKGTEEVESFARAMTERLRRPALRLELLTSSSATAAGLRGSGLIIVNPPWTLLDEADELLPALAGRLAQHGLGGYLCTTLAIG